MNYCKDWYCTLCNNCARLLYAAELEPCNFLSVWLGWIQEGVLRGRNAWLIEEEKKSQTIGIHRVLIILISRIVVIPDLKQPISQQIFQQSSCANNWHHNRVWWQLFAHEDCWENAVINSPGTWLHNMHSLSSQQPALWTCSYTAQRSFFIHPNTLYIKGEILWL